MLSIVIPTYGRSEEIKNMIISIQNAFPTDFYEIVIVSSDDPSSEKIKWLKEQKNTKVILTDIRNGVRLNSLYYYENIGIKNCKNEYILILNDDMVFTDDSFYKEMLNLSEYDIMYIQTHLGMYSLGRRLHIIDKVKTPSDNEYRDLYLGDFIVCRKSVYEKIGYLDENLDWYAKGMDISLNIELKFNEFKISYNNNLYLDHIISETDRTQLDPNIDFNYIKYKWETFCKENNGYYWINY